MKCADFQMENLDASHVPIFFRLSISYETDSAVGY